MTHGLFLSLYRVLCLFTLVLAIESQRNRSFTPFPNVRASRSFCFPPLHGLMRKDLKNRHFPVEGY